MSPPPIGEQSAAAVIARFLKARGVRRVYGLCGGHIMPIWMRLDAEGIRIIDVRDERAAVYMAHAEAQLTGGRGRSIWIFQSIPCVPTYLLRCSSRNVLRPRRVDLFRPPQTP